MIDIYENNPVGYERRSDMRANHSATLHCDRLLSDVLRNISARMSEVHKAESIRITTLDGLI